MAKATVRGYASGYNASGISPVDVGIPADAQAGDWLIVQLGLASASVTVATPVGWTLLASGPGIGTRSFYTFARRKESDAAGGTVSFVLSAGASVTWSMAYGPGGVVAPSDWVKRRYPNDVGTLFDYDKRYTYYLETGGTNGGNSTTTRIKGMAVPAGALVLTWSGEATGATETEAQVTLEGATKTYWYGAHATASHIQTHLWGADTYAAAATTPDVLAKYPNVQSSNGAGHQIAIPELVETTPAPTTPGATAFPVTMESGQPFTVQSQVAGAFTRAAGSARSGSFGLGAANNGPHRQALLPDDFRAGPGVRVSGWVRLDHPVGGTPNLAGLVVAGSDVSSEGTFGWQACIDSRNATNPSTAYDNQRGFHLRNSQGQASGSMTPSLLIEHGVWYFIEMDWREKPPLVVARLWREIDGEMKLQGTVQTAMSYLSPAKPQKIGVYAYGGASFDDFKYETVPAAPIKVVESGGVLSSGLLKMSEGVEANPLVPVERFWQVQRGRPISKWFEGGHVPIMAHRGGSANFAEHSARGYTECAILGVDIMEFSVGFTSDGKMFGLHDDTGNRTTPELPANTKPGDLTLAQWLALTQVRPTNGDKRFGRQPYIELKTALDAYLGDFSFMIDCKYGGVAGLNQILDLCDTYPNARDFVTVKYFHTATQLADLARSRGYKSWGYAYFVDVDGTNSVQLSATQAKWDFLGMEYGDAKADGSPSDRSVAAWNIVKSYGKPVFAHIIPSAAVANRALVLGADALQVGNVIDVMASRP
jgi:hypothetical protein